MLNNIVTLKSVTRVTQVYCKRYRSKVRSRSFTTG